MDGLGGLELWCLTPLLTIFQLYRCGWTDQFVKEVFSLKENNGFYFREVPCFQNVYVR